LKKIALLFFSAILSFLLFFYLDEYKTFIVPYFYKNQDGSSGLFDEKRNEEVVKALLLKFNHTLSEIYLSGDRSKLPGLPASDEVRKAIYEEITFLKGRGRRMDIAVKELTIREIKNESTTVMQVLAEEKAGVRYVAADGAGAAPYVEMEYNVVYTLAPGPEGLIVEAFESTPSGEKK